jgi:hypothetical protein
MAARIALSSFLSPARLSAWGVRALLPFLLLAAAIGGAEPAAPADSVAARADTAHVTVAPAWTSIYLGTVSLKVPDFTRRGSTYESSYTAKVIPFFFYNEKGRFSVDLDDAALARLARGETIEFKGRAVNAGGEERRVEAKATPADALTGKLKVRVFVSPKIELIFNTAYRFAPQSAP